MLKVNIPRTPRERSAILSSTPELAGLPLWTPPHYHIAGCWQINPILAIIGRKISIWILAQNPPYEIY